MVRKKSVLRGLDPTSDRGVSSVGARVEVVESWFTSLPVYVFRCCVVLSGVES